MIQTRSSYRTHRAEQVAPPRVDEYVQFWRAGSLASGSFCCVECGWRLTVADRLPWCPTCSGALWESTTSSPFRSSQGDAATLGPSHAIRYDRELKAAVRMTRALLFVAVAGSAFWLLLAALAYALFTLIEG